MRLSAIRLTIMPFVLAALSAGCNADRIADLEARNRKLAEERQTLQEQMSDRDRRIDATFAALNEIYDELARVDAEIVTLKPIEAGESGALDAVTEATHQHIDNLRQALEDKQRQIEDLVARNDKAGVRIASLNRRIKELSLELKLRQERIEALQAEIGGLHDLVSAQGVTIATQAGEIAEKTERIRTAEDRMRHLREEMERTFYVIGTEADLLTAGVIRREGGFLFGWGSVPVLNHPYPADRFMPTSVHVTELVVPGEVESLVPARGLDTYRLETAPSGTRVVILRPEAFWQERHLAVMLR